MSDQGSLFDTPPPRPPAPRAPAAAAAPPKADATFSVSRLNQAIERAMVESFPREVWVRGEIQGFDRAGRRAHRYFELVEKDARADRPRATINVVLFDGDRRARIEPTLRRNPDFRLQDNIEVRIRCRVRYWAQGGRLQLQMVGVDPSFTLGQLAVNRERILRQLRVDGLLTRNAALELSPVPLRVGLITSAGSAAFNDFTQAVSAAGLAFRIHYVDVRVQGLDAEATVLAALARFRRLRPDLVVLVRGGGSRSDLAAFDSERIARAIATMPVPVWTGIGHEIDRSVADEVAHRCFITPTACANALVERVSLVIDHLDGARGRLVDAATAGIARQETHLAHATRQMERATRSAVRTQGQALDRLSASARRETRRVLGRQHSRLRHVSGQTRTTALLRLSEQRGALDALTPHLRRTRLVAPLARAQARLDRGQRALGLAARQVLAGAEADLKLMATQVAAADPKRALARGWSLTYDADGRLIRSAGQVRPGDRMVTRVADGNIPSQALAQAEAEES